MKKKSKRKKQNKTKTQTNNLVERLMAEKAKRGKEVKMRKRKTCRLHQEEPVKEGVQRATLVSSSRSYLQKPPPSQPLTNLVIFM